MRQNGERLISEKLRGGRTVSKCLRCGDYEATHCTGCLVDCMGDSETRATEAIGGYWKDRADKAEALLRQENAMAISHANYADRLEDINARQETELTLAKRALARCNQQVLIVDSKWRAENEELSRQLQAQKGRISRDSLKTISKIEQQAYMMTPDQLRNCIKILAGIARRSQVAVSGPGEGVDTPLDSRRCD